MKNNKDQKPIKNTAIFRLYTEAWVGKNDMYDLQRLVSEYTDGATIYQVLGLWKGKTESSVVIEIHHAVGNKFDVNDGFAKYRELAKKIADANNQDVVRVVYQEGIVVDVMGGER